MQISNNSSNISEIPITCFLNEEKAAEESIRSKLYITWVPIDNSKVAASASEDIKAGGVGQCCRISQSSWCSCGHSLSDHESPKLSKKTNSTAYIKPPKCSVSRCKCQTYQYSPCRPEECGQWWLIRRKDFNISTWMQVISYIYCD